MIKSQLDLVILVLDARTNRYKILSTKEDELDLPSIDIEINLDVESCLSHLLSVYVEKNDSYHNFKLTDISLSDVLKIYHMVFITYECNLQDSFLLDIKETLTKLPNNVQKILSLL